MIIEQGLSIGDAAKASGLTEDTLRYYERIGLTPFVERAPSGHRRYSEDDLQWLAFVTNMRKTGMSIETLQRYAALIRPELEQCLEVVDYKLARLDKQKG